MPKTVTKRPLSPVERAVERQKMLALLGYQDRALSQGKALWNAGKGFVNEGLGSLIAGAEYAGDRGVTKEVPKDINRLGKMVAQNAGGYADAGNALWQMVKGDGKQAVPDYYRNKAGQAYQEQFNPSPADPRLERFGNFYADPLAVGFGTGRAARGLADPKLYRQIAEDMARGGRTAVVQDGLLGKMVAPQDEALRVAQANAAKPVSEGGLGDLIGGDDYDVIRYDADGDIPTFDKPHGIYTTPAGVASPHTGVGGNVSKWKMNPEAKVLNIEIDDGPSLAMRPGAKGAGGGVATVRHLLGQDTFNSIKGLKKDQLIDWIGKNTDFDPATFSNYFDSQEVMEGLGGLLARKNGYSAISYADRTPFWSSPEWDERILLSEDAVRK